MSKVQTYLEQKGPRVFTIASGENFQMVLAKGVIAAITEDPDPFALHDTIILVPTRRASRSMAGAFLQVLGQDNAAILPQILPIGDVDADEPPFIAGPTALDIPPEISTSNRLFSLARIILYRAQASGQNITVSAALNEAAAIAKLMDSAIYEGVTDFSLASEEFAPYLQNQPEHIQRAARFLDIINSYWPKELKEQRLIDQAKRRTILLQTLCDQWSRNPTPKRVIVAGSTGSQQATANLLSIVARLPNGCVVLPGFDQELDKNAWEQVVQTPGHPQYGMARLLLKVGIERDQVALWPQSSINLQQSRRRRIINEALTPADITSDWLKRLEKLGQTHDMPVSELMKDALHGLGLIEAQTQDEEALSIALAIRKLLETPDKTAMLVTPDRALARRVRAALQRWSIDVDDSAGQPLSENPLGIFLQLALNWWADPGDPLALLALLNHPLACLGQNRQSILQAARALDLGYLRGVRTHKGIEHLLNRVGKKDDMPQNHQVYALLGFLKELAQEFSITDYADISDFASQHAKLVERLAANDELSGAERLWIGPAGEQASSLFRDLIADSHRVQATGFEEYERVFSLFSTQASVRLRRPKGGRVRILGPLEARQQTADLIILGGLDEGVWPSASGADPFLPRSLIKKMKLPDPERRLGLAAHDFAELACKPNVILTRAGRRDGTPTIASRWLWRLKTLIDAGIGKDQRKDILRPQSDFLTLSRALGRVEKVHPVCEPLPKPPVSVRPKSLYVTHLRTLIRNPFAIYGQKILRLQPLDPIGAKPGGRERGNAIHQALQQWHDKRPGTTANDLSQLIIEQLCAHGFQESELAIEAPAARRIAQDYIRWAKQRQQDGFIPYAFEQGGSLTLSLKDGQEIIISAKCDRIDRFGKSWTVMDYKTGQMPGQKEVWAGYDPQLPVTGLIICGNGFEAAGIAVSDIEELGYLQLSRGRTPLTYRTIADSQTASKPSPQALQEKYLKEILDLFETFNDSRTPYLCQPRAKYVDSYSSFDHLARRVEWTAVLDEGES